MQKVNNYCRGCEHFTQYYEAGLFNYWAREHGFCSSKQAIVKQKNTCDKFCKQTRTPLTVEEIDCAIYAVKQIKKIIEIEKYCRG